MIPRDLPDQALYFPPEPGCYGCLSTGFLVGFGARAGIRCVCVEHELGECEPGCCSPECRARAERREKANLQ